MNRSTATSIKIHPIQDYSSLLALKPSWDAVWSGSRQRWPSTTWTWIASWWQNLRDDHSLVVLQVSRESRPIGIAPFSWRSSGSGFSRHVEIAGNALIDFGDVVSVAEEEEIVNSTLAQHFLERRVWESLSLDRLMWSKERIQAWVTPFRNADHTVNIVSSANTWRASLTGGWDGFSARLGSRWREHLRRKQRRLEGRGAVFFEAQSAEEARQLLKALYHFRAQTDEKEALPPQVDRHFQFHSTILDELLRLGLARVFGLKVDGVLVASEYMFRYGDSCLHYLPGYSREWKEYSPGNVLLAHCIQSACHAGFSVMDLGIGDEEYKTHWLAQPVPTQKVTVHSRGAASRVRRGADKCARAGNRVFRALKNLVVGVG